MIQLQRAIEDTLRNSDMSVDEIAGRIGMGSQVLRNKCNSNNDTHKLGLLEAMAIQLATKDTSIHRAMGLELESLNAKFESKGVIPSLLTLTKDYGSLVGVVTDALDDNRLTPREHEECQRGLDQMIKSIMDLRLQLASHDDGGTKLRGVS